LGDTTFGVRAASPVLHFFTAIFVYFIARDIYNNNKIAFFSAVTYTTLPRQQSLPALFPPMHR
jgi:4-amino-4-deoxy-L-arabinose transferase-like glycosyltransferase